MISCKHRQLWLLWGRASPPTTASTDLMDLPRADCGGLAEREVSSNTTAPTKRAPPLARAPLLMEREGSVWGPLRKKSPCFRVLSVSMTSSLPSFGINPSLSHVCLFFNRLMPSLHFHQMTVYLLLSKATCNRTTLTHSLLQTNADLVVQIVLPCLHTTTVRFRCQCLLITLVTNIQKWSWSPFHVSEKT